VRIFYALGGDFIAGGQLNTLAHIATLRAWGHDARLLVVRRPDRTAGYAPNFPPGQEVPWQLGVDGLGAGDVVVVGEMFGIAALAIKDLPVRRVLHNQNPFYSFEAFLDVRAMREWRTERILCASHFIEDFLIQAGWDGPTSVVRPYIDPMFSAPPGPPGQPAIAYMPRKRGRDAKLIRGVLRSRHPDLDWVPWVALENAPRAECARVLKLAGVFLSLSLQEGLGLPPLEAMSAGALVVGFHGEGGREYATPENGDWFEDGQIVAVADALAACIDGLKRGEGFEARRAAGRASAAAFSRQAFEAQLRAAWAELL